MTSRFTFAVVVARLSGALAAVKVHRSSERLHRVFRQELDALQRVRHPHIVCLLAFCASKFGFTEEGMLVLEFAANGNLHERFARKSQYCAHDGEALFFLNCYPSTILHEHTAMTLQN
ncbi:unnamed protein product [Urochloa humidicola]